MANSYFCCGRKIRQTLTARISSDPAAYQMRNTRLAVAELSPTSFLRFCRVVCTASMRLDLGHGGGEVPVAIKRARRGRQARPFFRGERLLEVAERHLVVDDLEAP